MLAIVRADEDAENHKVRGGGRNVMMMRELALRYHTRALVVATLQWSAYETSCYSDRPDKYV